MGLDRRCSDSSAFRELTETNCIRLGMHVGPLDRSQPDLGELLGVEVTTTSIVRPGLDSRKLRVSPSNSGTRRIATVFAADHPRAAAHVTGSTVVKGRAMAVARARQ